MCWTTLPRILAQRQHQAVFADGEADAGRLGAAERFGKPVVAASAEDRVLRAQCAMGELKGGAGVVVEAADQAVVDVKLDADCFQNFLHLLEMLAARFVERIG